MPLKSRKRGSDYADLVNDDSILKFVHLLYGLPFDVDFSEQLSSEWIVIEAYLEVERARYGDTQGSLLESAKKLLGLYCQHHSVLPMDTFPEFVLQLPDGTTVNPADNHKELKLSIEFHTY